MLIVEIMNFEGKTVLRASVAVQLATEKNEAAKPCGWKIPPCIILSTGAITHFRHQRAPIYRLHKEIGSKLKNIQINIS